MPISFNCPSCQKKLTVKDEMAGKVAKCPCGTQLKIPQAAAAPAAQAPTGLAPANPATADSAFAGVPTGNLQQPVGQAPMTPQAPMAAPGAPANPNAPAMPQNINPDFKIQCLQCGQEYPMRPDLFGQTVACKCGAPITFEDPLGAGGSMMNQTPLDWDAAMAEANTPLAYQSQTQKQAESKKAARQREDEVLKMYLKDDGTEDKPKKSFLGGTKKPKANKKSSASPASPKKEGKMHAGRIIQGIIGIAALYFIGILMIAQPGASAEIEWGEKGLKGIIMKLIWCRPTGIVITVIAGLMTLAVIIAPKKTFLVFSEDDDDDE